nr:hypothetical protein [Tessaracoccus coleopterorum]
MALSVADRLRDQGVAAVVVDPLWALPISPDLVAAADGFDLVLTLEDNLVEGASASGCAHASRRPARPRGSSHSASRSSS